MSSTVAVLATCRSANPGQLVGDGRERAELAVDVALVRLVAGGEVRPEALDVEARYLTHRLGEREELLRRQAVAVEAGLDLQVHGER